MNRIRNFPRAVVLSAMIAGAGAMSTFAVAQDSVSESHLEAAKKVAAATKVLEPFDNILPVLAEQTRTAFIQAQPTFAEEIIEITQDVAISLAPRRSELNNQVYVAWTQNFTEAELNELAEFYSTELGQKLTQKVPEISAFSLSAAREWQDKISTDMVTLVQAEIEKRNSAQ